ncbi:MAG: hypothetical protein ACR2LE_07780 [Nocardioidaceae bacterium]
MGAEIEQIGDDLMVARQGSLLVLQGPQALVERLIANEPALRDRPPSKPSQAGALRSLAALQSLLPTGGMHQQVFKLDATALKQIKVGQITQAANGKLSMLARGADGRFLKQAELIPIDINPADALNFQMALLTLAMTSAINEVAEAVARVEDKVDRLTDLLDAERVGAIIGAHRALTRRAGLGGSDGTLADADWHAIDNVGIQVEQQIESLRSYVRKRLIAAEARGSGIADRRDALDDVGDLSEALSLLLVTQDSLFLFQQLRLARIRDHEPARLAAAIDETRSLLAEHETEDAGLLTRVRQVVADQATVQALEIHRFITAGSLVETAGEVDHTLSWFAAQRTLAYEPINEVEVPGISEVVDELRDRGEAVAAGGRRLAAGVMDRVRSRDDGPDALPAGDEPSELPASAEPEEQDALTDDRTSGTGTDRLRSALSRTRRAGVERLRRVFGAGHDDNHENTPPF